MSAVPPTTAGVVTLGCRLNIAESERIAAMLGGHPDIVIVNGCGVTGAAMTATRAALRRARRDRPDARLIVTGCASEIDPAMFEGLADAIVPNAAKLDAAAYGLPARPPAAAAGPTRARAFVAVQNGCDHACTFCIIPKGRGPNRSLPAGAVVAAVRAAVDGGAREVVLTGVDLTSWGADLPGRPAFAGLVARVLALVPGLPRLRLSSLDPAAVDDALVALIGAEPRIMPHVHLSLQAGSDLILKRMRRRHRRAGAVALAARLRSARPGVAIGADLIAGFPTEDEAAFADTLAIVDEAGVVLPHVFPYSARAGTPAARMPQVPQAIVRERAARLRAAGERARAAWLDARVGTADAMLVERDGLTGHAGDFAKLRLARAATPNAILPVRLTGRDGDTLLAEAA